MILIDNKVRNCDYSSKHNNCMKQIKQPAIKTLAKTHLPRALFFLAIMIVGACLIILSPRQAKAAGTATLTLSPSSGTFDSGQNFTVVIHENSGSTDINEATAVLAYDQTKLQYISNDISASNFDVPGDEEGGNGLVTLALGNDNVNLTGDQVVGSVTFKMLATSGTAAITFSDVPVNGVSSDVRYPGSANLWDDVTTGGTYTVTSSGAGTGSGSSGSVSTSTGSVSTGSSSGSSSGKTSTTTTTTQPNSTSSSAPSTSSNPAVASGGTVGYPVAIKVVDSQGKIVANAQVILDGTETEITDTTGVAGFTNVPAGTHKVSVTGTTNKKATVLGFTVNAPSPLAVQQFQVKLAAAKPLTSYLWIPILIVVLLIIFGGGFTIINHVSSSVDTGGSVVSGDKPGPSAIAAAKIAPVMSSPATQPRTPSTPAAPGTVKTQVFYPSKAAPRQDPNPNPETTNKPEVGQS